MKSNIFSSNSSIMVVSYIQVYQIFKHNIVFTIKSNVLLQQFQHSGCKYHSNILIFSTVLFHSFSRKSNTFFQQLIPVIFSFIHFHFDSGELSREPKSLHSLIRSLIYESFQFKNTLIFYHVLVLLFYMFTVRFKNHHKRRQSNTFN